VTGLDTYPVTGASTSCQRRPRPSAPPFSRIQTPSQHAIRSAR